MEILTIIIVILLFYFGSHMRGCIGALVVTVAICGVALTFPVAWPAYLLAGAYWMYKIRKNNSKGQMEENVADSVAENTNVVLECDKSKEEGNFSFDSAIGEKINMIETTKLKCCETESDDMDVLDEYFWDAAIFVSETGKASVSMLQRKYRIGYNRASKLIDLMERYRIVGPETGAAPRKTLLTVSEAISLYDSIQNKNVDSKEVLQGKDDVELGSPKRSILSKEEFNQYILSLSGYDFEEYCVNVLKSGGFENVEQTSLSCDFGADILAEKDTKKYAIQCKRQSHPVGIKAVQEVLSGALYYDCDVAMVLTNQEFTLQAQEMAEKANVILMNIFDLLMQLYFDDEYRPRIGRERLIEVAKDIEIAYRELGYKLECCKIETWEHNTSFYFKKEDHVRIKQITDLKLDVGLRIKNKFTVKPDFKKGYIVMVFNSFDLINE